MNRTNLINYVLYQAGWFACVLGAAAGHPWLGASVAALLLVVHLALTRERGLEASLIASAVGVGLIVEFVQLRSGTYRLTSGLSVDGLAPAWLLMMWSQFATTFRYSLRSVMTHLPRAALFGAAGGPIAFLAGERLGAVTLLPPVSLGLVRLVVAWAVAVGLLALVTHRLAPGNDAATYRID